MIYGIDLGTTNSVISIYNPQSQVSKQLSGLLPSVVNMITGDVGESEKENLYRNLNTNNILSSFKVDITTDISGKPSITASALVLSELKNFMKYGEKDVVITVPAYFLNSQREATKEAAKIAGLNVVSLINEPTAAALYYLRNIPDKVVVYDLGGGTFDVTVIDTSYGISDVQATLGTKIGGDDLNTAIYQKLCLECSVIRHRLSEGDKKALIEECERLKLQIQKKRETVKFDFTNKPFAKAFEKTVFYLTEDMYKYLVGLTFGHTKILLNKVIKKSGYKLNDLKLILVGGSTRDPYVVEMLRDIKEPEKLTYNPDEIVSQGAAYFAYLKYTGYAETVVSDITKGLGIGLYTGELKLIIEPQSKIPVSNKVLLRNYFDTDKLILNLYQGDSKLANENDLIGRLVFNYGKTVKAGEGIICVCIYISADGIISLSARESLSKEVEIKIETC